MENHPIPQDVTGFQFKLIGNMTIKQFALLSVGVVLAWVMYLSPLPGFIKIPLSIVLLFFGFGLAFVPIEGRSMDVIILHFIKALFTPNQYIFQKSNTQIIHTGHLPASTNTAVAQIPQMSPVATQEVQPEKKEEPKQEMQKEETVNAQYQILQQNLQQALQEKANIEKELLELKQILTQQKQISTPPPPPQQVEKVTTPIVKIVPVKSAPKTAGFPIPEAANILTGIVRDARGNILPNILVEVKDKDGNPVRAFKTNQLGQFASATPLLDGVYTLTFEDPGGKQKFNTLELTMVGEIIGPIEVISIDQREELRKALFN